PGAPSTSVGGSTSAGGDGRRRSSSWGKGALTARRSGSAWTPRAPAPTTSARSMPSRRCSSACVERTRRSPISRPPWSGGPTPSRSTARTSTSSVSRGASTTRAPATARRSRAYRGAPPASPLGPALLAGVEAREAAVPLYRPALDRPPEDPLARRGLARALLDTGHAAESASRFAEVEKSDPEYQYYVD